MYCNLYTLLYKVLLNFVKTILVWLSKWYFTLRQKVTPCRAYNVIYDQ